jgi:tRNA(fMet)-specific endonuclease VapC
VSGSYLLDTKAVIALLKAENSIQELLAGIDETFLSFIVLGEPYFGAEKSQRTQANLLEIERFAAGCTVLGCNLETARHYGRIKLDLMRKGCPIPENDLWIAATARQHDLSLVTRDGHFDDIEGLSLLRWNPS